MPAEYVDSAVIEPLGSSTNPQLKMPDQPPIDLTHLFLSEPSIHMYAMIMPIFPSQNVASEMMATAKSQSKKKDNLVL